MSDKPQGFKIPTLFQYNESDVTTKTAIQVLEEHKALNTELSDQAVPFFEELSILNARMASVTASINVLKADTKVICHASKCQVSHKVKDLVYIQTHYYVPPRGCSEGDYYVLSEGQFDCPTCGYRNRLYYRKYIEALKPFFNSSVDEY